MTHQLGQNTNERSLVLRAFDVDRHREMVLAREDMVDQVAAELPGPEFDKELGSIFINLVHETRKVHRLGIGLCNAVGDRLRPKRDRFVAGRGIEFDSRVLAHGKCVEVHDTVILELRGPAVNGQIQAQGVVLAPDLLDDPPAAFRVPGYDYLLLRVDDRQVDALFPFYRFSNTRRACLEGE